MAMFSSRQSTHLFEVLVGVCRCRFDDFPRYFGGLFNFVLTVPYIFRKCCTVCIFFVAE